MSYPSSTSNKIAIVGGDPLVGRALELSLQSAGYSARFLDGSSVNGAYDPLEGLGLVGVELRGWSCSTWQLLPALAASPGELGELPAQRA